MPIHPRYLINNQIITNLGIMNTEGKMWKEQRRFLHERLRHFGIKHAGSGREMMEARIMVIIISSIIL